jgi:hypothetical protein
LKDRIVSLGSVDRFFAYDKVLLGVSCSHYGPYKLHWYAVLMEIEQRVKLLTKDMHTSNYQPPRRQLRMVRNAAAGTVIAAAAGDGDGTFSTTEVDMYRSQYVERNRLFVAKN